MNPLNPRHPRLKNNWAYSFNSCDLRMKNVYFLSDAHLGSRAIPHSRTQERRLVNFLDQIKNDAAAVYLLGDMFDFWYEFKTVVPKGYTRFLGNVLRPVIYVSDGCLVGTKPTPLFLGLKTVFWCIKSSLQNPVNYANVLNQHIFLRILMPNQTSPLCHRIVFLRCVAGLFYTRVLVLRPDNHVCPQWCFFCRLFCLSIVIYIFQK